MTTSEGSTAASMENSSDIILKKWILEVNDSELLQLLILLKKAEESTLPKTLMTQLQQQNYTFDTYQPMSYNEFTLVDVRDKFNLKIVGRSLFTELNLFQASDFSLLTRILTRNKKVAIKSEQSRCEALVFPLLIELMERNADQMSLFSDETFDVDESKGLKGRCDYLLSAGQQSYIIEAPVFAIVEAKQAIIEKSMGQCAAAMFAARLFNEKKEKPYKTIYGAISSGREWQFLKLEGGTLWIDKDIYFENQLVALMSILQTIVDFYKNY